MPSSQHAVPGTGERATWKPGFQRYDAAMRELATRSCQQQQRAVQDLVFKLKLQKRAKDQETSSTARTKIRRKMMRQRQ